MFKVKAFICEQQYINKLYTIFTNAFSCIKTNSISVHSAIVYTGSNPIILVYFGMGISSAWYLQEMYTGEYKQVTDFVKDRLADGATG